MALSPSWVRYLEKFKNLFSTTSPEPTPDLGPVLAHETVARYIVHDRHFSSQKRQVKAAAFEPDPRGEKSVFRVTELGEAARWALGVEQVEPFSESPVKARGDLSCADVHAEVLQFRIDKADHFRHANIVGWPGEKSLAKLKAAQLALKAIFVPRP